MIHLRAARGDHSGCATLILSLCYCLVILSVFGEVGNAADTNEAAERGWQHLRTKPYLPPDFDQTVFENLWRRWLDPLRSQAKDASPAERRQLTFSYYGLIEPPDDPGEGAPLGYVDTGDGNRVMNCLACHAGKVAGKVIPGLPNSHFALQTLTEDVRLTKLTLFKNLGHLDRKSVV